MERLKEAHFRDVILLYSSATTYKTLTFSPVDESNRIDAKITESNSLIMETSTCINQTFSPLMLDPLTKPIRCLLNTFRISAFLPSDLKNEHNSFRTMSE